MSSFARLYAACKIKGQMKKYASENEEVRIQPEFSFQQDPDFFTRIEAQSAKVYKSAPALSRQTIIDQFSVIPPRMSRVLDLNLILQFKGVVLLGAGIAGLDPDTILYGMEFLNRFSTSVPAQECKEELALLASGARSVRFIGQVVLPKFSDSQKPIQGLQSHDSPRSPFLASWHPDVFYANWHSGDRERFWPHFHGSQELNAIPFSRAALLMKILQLHPGSYWDEKIIPGQRPLNHNDCHNSWPPID